ncbi:MAG: PhnD/SsuA/transferrin family substrate-binding protein [Alphaproteobacteria bacterium]|nr:PhnD/SsuA/transferrin family substrate-binding protein [Alphaproteobacteria bacterium]MBV9551815.1 PhnD/SsuA/transferrin family substrate-binding protein [Alphaproteobacteria bacterium]
MYNLPEMRAANGRFWEALRGLLIEAGLQNVPEKLSFERGPVPQRLEAELLFSQTCGYPLETVFKGQAIRLGAPLYDVPGCTMSQQGPTHRAFFLVRADSPVQTLADLKGTVFLLNSPVSNSGMNLPRRALAGIVGSNRFFSRVVETGGHPASLDCLIQGSGDVASIDCVTYAFWKHHRPEAAAQVRILAQTPVSPAIPFVTSATTPPATVDLLRRALRAVASEPRYARVRTDLKIAGIADVPDAAYAGLLDYEREAAALGYPMLV